MDVKRIMIQYLTKHVLVFPHTQKPMMMLRQNVTQKGDISCMTSVKRSM